MIRLLSSKKGITPRNIIYPLVTLIVFVFMVFIGIVILGYVINAFQLPGVHTDNMDGAIAAFEASYNWWDYVTLFLVFSFIVGIAITSYRLRARPVGYILAFILAPFYGAISYFLNYYFVQLVSPAQFDAVRAYFPMTMIICTNLHWIALVMLLIGAIMLYSYNQDEGGQGGYMA